MSHRKRRVLIFVGMCIPVMSENLVWTYRSLELMIAPSSCTIGRYVGLPSIVARNVGGAEGQDTVGDHGSPVTHRSLTEPHLS